MTSRMALRVSVVSAVSCVLVSPLLAAAPAWAAGRLPADGLSASGMDDGEMSGPGLSALQTLLIYVGIPVALFVVITLLVLAPSMARGPRYRPGLGWWAAPVWFNGPADADTAVRAAAPTTEAGGSSARW